ncbi:FG-GAP repeat domain-containing protein, partial [Bacteroidota bacterium]
MDDNTPRAGLSFNIYIDTISGGNGINTPMANITDGFRRIVKNGSSQDSVWTIHNLDTGKYYWGVQAIDNNFAGSAFAIEDSFVITFKNSISPVDTQYLIPGENGTPLVIYESETIDSRQWRYSTVPGGPYNDIDGATDNSYTPNLSSGDVYYIVCVSTKGSETVTSNEVLIMVSNFEEQTEISFRGVQNGTTAWGDYDNDGDLDILLTGYGSLYGQTIIYKNNGNIFTEQTSLTFIEDIRDGIADWGDYDNDGYLDIILAGQDNTGNSTTKIYKNYGNNTFTEQTGISLTGIKNGMAVWGDYNNDGYLDILIVGQDESNNFVSKIYKNNGNNTFTEQTGINLKGVFQGSVEWGDYNNDEFLDVLLTGNSNAGAISKLYKNNGDNTFTEQTNVLLEDVRYSSATWGDYNNDGYLDILLAGRNNSHEDTSKIYKNNGNGTFTEQTNISLIGLSFGSANWGDYNNDGYLDILLTGYNNSDRITKIYKNNGDNTFSEIDKLANVALSTAGWGDYDNDGDLDIILTGLKDDKTQVTLLYKNKFPIANTNPEN